MISLKVLDIKSFMTSLLINNVFDNFFVTEFDINTFTQFHISGNINEEFYNSDELELLEGRKYVAWSEIKPIAYTLIKGNKLPLSIKIVFLLSPANTINVLRKSGVSMRPEEVNGLFLNVRYDKGNLYLITGTSIKTFTLDKTLERVWDSDVKTFLKHYQIAVEEAS